MTRILIITGDPIGPRMAGPAIRAWNMARVLAAATDDTGASHEVVLMTTTRLAPVEPPSDAPFEVREVRPDAAREFAALEAWADAVVFQGHAMRQFPSLRRTSKIVVADIYDPMHLEMLEQGRELPRATWELRVRTATEALTEQLALADFFVCASERQRHFYLGQLATLGRITPATYENDPHLRGLIDVAPFGLDATPPVHERASLKGVIDGIGERDRLLIWGGGLYSWFDPKTLILAVADLAARRPETKLYFLGTRHPGVEPMGIVRESFDLARELGALGESVFFNEDWVDYADRQSFLAEADAGVSTHMSHVETTFSFRTRILDYLWAGLPMVVTEGDSFAELVEREELGVVVPAQDVAALRDGLERVLYDEEFSARARANVARVREHFVWERALAPLVEFLRAPRHAADWSGERTPRIPFGGARRAHKTHGFAHNVRMTWHHLRHGGVRVVREKIAGRLRRR